MEIATIISIATFLVTLFGVAAGYGKLKGEVKAVMDDLKEHKQTFKEHKADDLRIHTELKEQLTAYETKIDKKLDRIQELIMEIKSNN